MKTIALLTTPPEQPDHPMPVSPTLSFPDSAIVRNGNPVFLPDFDSEFTAIPYLAVKINRLGKSIAPKFAERYYSEVTCVMVLTALNLLQNLREAGLPWNAAVGFDKSLTVGDFFDRSLLGPDSTFDLRYLTVGRDGKVDEQPGISFPIPSREEIAACINEVSRYNSLKMGDYILVPMSDYSIAVEIDSLVTVEFDGKRILKMPVK